MQKGVLSFFKNHRILTHLILMVVVVFILLYFAIKFMDVYTRHGVEVVVPEIKKLTVEEAMPILERQDLSCQIIDSIYNKNMRPGVILEQIPREGSAIKRDKDIYVIINTIMPRQVPFPEVRDISYRQASSMIEGLGFPKPDIEYEVSQYKDLVISVKLGNKQVDAGDKYPLTTKFTIVVGQGMDAIDAMEEDTLDIIY
ncbi:MAG: PASTA domain-containing protein [Bacteroidales bacterium]|nr:PASTA domain-containing protein [Bacteroidales bacterium]MBR5532252.1 PASTA domain-containing protein [Bacteroidales bacterium]